MVLSGHRDMRVFAAGKFAWGEHPAGIRLNLDRAHPSTLPLARWKRAISRSLPVTKTPVLIPMFGGTSSSVRIVSKSPDG